MRQRYATTTPHFVGITNQLQKVAANLSERRDVVVVRVKQA